MAKKKYKIPVWWSMSGTVEIEADSLEEAIDKAETDSDISLPEDSYYIDDSWEVNRDEDMINYLNKEK